MRRKRSRWQVQHVALALFVVFLIPLLIALLSWATSFPSLHSVMMLLLALLVAAAGVFGLIRDWGRGERRPLRTR
ncbi:MAG: hypothetical protein J5I81_03385 [Nitrococcus mobilis]|nr:hypothetical protein [Nitrococcus mobilis]